MEVIADPSVDFHTMAIDQVDPFCLPSHLLDAGEII